MLRNNDDLILRADAAHFYAVSGQTEKARSELSELKQLSKEKYVSAFSLAMIAVGLKEDDAAFEYFDQAVEAHSDMLVYLNVDPRLDRIRADDRFHRMIKKVGLPERSDLP
jgi:hypothetical protein